jgi:hypothetical protein
MGKSLLITSLVLVSAATALAQTQRNIRTIDRFYLKPGRAAEFKELAAKYVEIHKKAGIDEGWSVWQSQTGPSEMVVVSYSAKWAEFDEVSDPKLKSMEADLARLSDRMNQTLDHRTRIIDEIMPEHSMGWPSKDMPKMVRVLENDVKPDKVTEYMDLIKAEVMPAYKKGGVPMYMLSRTRYGGPASQFRSVIPMESWAAFDGKTPIEKALGESGMKALIQKIGGFVTRQQATIYKFVPEGSYLPATGGASGGN